MCSGANAETNLVLVMLPFRCILAQTVRIAGYPSRANTDVIITTSGAVMISGSVGENKNNIEVGCGYITFD